MISVLSCLTLDDFEWYALLGHFDGVGVAQLVGSEAPPHSGLDGELAQRGRGRR